MRHFVVLVTYSGKPTSANSILRRMPTHWEWRDGGSSVYPHGWNVARLEVCCALRWRGDGLVWEDPVARLIYARLSSTLSCDMESPAGT